MASATSIMAGAAFIKLTMDNASLQKGINKAQNSLQKFGMQVEAFANKMTMLAPMFMAPLMHAANTFAAFDDQMRLTAAITGATGKQFQRLTELAKKLGRETSFTAEQVAAGMVALGRMGFNSTQIEQAIKPMMNLARTTGTELPLAAEIAGNTLRALNIDVSKTSSVVDILMTTANGSAQTLEDLGEALKYAAPAARTVGEDIYDVNAALGVLANVGIRGSIAGNALKRAYSELAKTDVQNYLRQFNVQVVDSQGNMRKYADILRDCVVAMQTMGSAQKLEFANKVFGDRAAPAALAITADTTKIDEFLEKLRSCEGSAARVAEQMDAGLGGAMRRLASAVEGISIALGGIIAVSFSPMLESVSQVCTAFAQWLSDSQGLTTTIISMTGAVIGFGVALKAFSLFGSMLKSLFSPLTALNNWVLALGHSQQTAASSALVHMAAQGKLSTANLFGAACSMKHAKAVLTTRAADLAAAAAKAQTTAVTVGQTVAYYAEAVAAKAAAVATMTLKAALDLLCSNPITIILLALVAIIAAIVNAVNEAEEATRKYTEELKEQAEAAEQAREAGDRTRGEAESAFERLQELEEISRRQALTAEEMKETEMLINKLDPFGSANWAKLDTITGKLTMAKDALHEFNKALHDSAVADVDAEYAKQEALISQLESQLSDSAARDFWSTLTFGAVDSVDEVNAPILKQLAAERQKLDAIRMRKNALKEKKVGSASGEDAVSKRAARAAAAREAALAKMVDAEKQMAALEAQNSEQKTSALDKELAKVKALWEQYIALAEAKREGMVALKDQAIGRRDYNAAARYRKQIAAHDMRVRDEKYRFAARYKEVGEKNNRPFTSFIADNRKAVRQREAEKRQDRRFDSLLRGGTDPQGRQMLDNFIRTLSGELLATEREYQAMLKEFQASNSESGRNIGGSEAEQLRALQKKIVAQTQQLESYRDRISSGQGQAQRTHRTVATFNASALKNIFDKKGEAKESMEERMARATEETARNTRILTRQRTNLAIG